MFVSVSDILVFRIPHPKRFLPAMSRCLISKRNIETAEFNLERSDEVNQISVWYSDGEKIVLKSDYLEQWFKDNAAKISKLLL